MIPGLYVSSFVLVLSSGGVSVGVAVAETGSVSETYEGVIVAGVAGVVAVGVILAVSAVNDGAANGPDGTLEETGSRGGVVLGVKGETVRG